MAVIEGQLLPEIERAEANHRRLTLPPDAADLDPADAVAHWPDFPPATKRTYARVLADLVVTPAARRGPVFDAARLDQSRWIGDNLTWGQKAAS